MALPSITEDMAQEAFIRYADSKCCYGTAPAEEGVITGMEAFNTYKYRLVTFQETRTTQLSFEPYNGQPVATPFGETVASIWDVPVQAPNFFQQHEESVRLPNTLSVENCQPCLGNGKILCTFCSGRGNIRCDECSGRGVGLELDGSLSPCTACRGRGRIICSACCGVGFCRCTCCNSRGKVVEFTELNVKWTNHTDSVFVAERACGITEEKLQNVSGKMIYKNSHRQVSYVRDFADSAVVEESKRLVIGHQNGFISNDSRIRQQCQTIELIPVTRVSYTWRRKCFQYLVYGEECRVTTKDYPASCCCCCNCCCVLL